MSKRQYENPEKKRKEARKKHKCNECMYAQWLNSNTVVFCTRPSYCIKEDTRK